MIFDKFIHRVMNRTALTLDDPAYWHTGGTLFGGQAVQAMKLPAVSACIEIISDSKIGNYIFLLKSNHFKDILLYL